MKTKDTYLTVQGWFSSTDRKVYEEAVKHFRNNSVFVEIGCFMGRSTVAMADLIEESKKNIIFYAIDHFNGSIEHENLQVIKENKLYEIFEKNIEQHKNTIKVIKSDSLSASSAFSDNSIDFVYIDASHDEKSVSQDLTFWYPKLKRFGWLSGHDYGQISVQNAVNEFMRRESNHIKNFTLYDGSWLIKLNKSFNSFEKLLFF